MNRLLSFNPEPFETDSELEAALQEYEHNGLEQEGEFEFRGRRGGSSSFRTKSARQHPTRPSLKPRRAAFGSSEPPTSFPDSPFRPPRRRDFGFPVFPIAENPLEKPEPREPFDGWRPGGEPGAGASSGLPSEYVRWVQSCLNQYLGLQLPVDGIMNAATRSAIRSFQERRGLRVDGLAGPSTEEALRTACKAVSPAAPAADARDGEAPSAPQTEWEFGAFARPRRRTGSRPVLASTPSPGATATFDSQAFRQKIVRIANQELARWGNGAIKETDPRIRRALQDYWKTGAGVSYDEDQLGDPAFQKDHAWSAAFISWLMKTAGAGNDFKYSASHAVYTRAAKDNRHANNNNPFKAYRITELAPQVGDLICKSRAGSGATYDNFRPGMKTHCDLVTEVRPGSLVTIGGNVNNSVAQKTLRTDANGRIAEPNYFAVIRIDGKQPSTPTAPPPTPSVGSAPKLIKQESTPAQSTLYVDIDLKIVDKFGIVAPPMTGIFIPDGYAPDAAVDLILYLHGHKAEAIRRKGIDQYWNSQRFAYGALREGVNASARNVILVAPTLGSRSEAERLLLPGGLDAYIEKVLAALRAYGPHRQAKSPPALGNLILACHSGGGLPMRQLAGGRDRAVAHIRECWGYDCTYNKGDEVFWAGWARAHPNAKVYIYYIPGSPTAPLAEGLRNRRVQNAIVQPSRDKRHNYVPITHWRERVQGAGFLAARSGGAVQPAKKSKAAPPSGFVPVFHPGVEHNHAPTGRWGDVQSDSRTRCGGLIQTINVLDLLRDPAKLRMLPLADVNECACAFLSPDGVFRVAREVVMFDLPLARRHLDHYRSGKGRDLVVDLKDIVRADAKFRAKLGAQVKKRRSGHIRIEQNDYSVKDFVFALGAIDRLDFEVDRSAGVVHAWFKDRYEWHPVGFGYRRLPGDVRRPSNCVHAAMVELKSSGAADYWMIGAAVLPLSLF